MSVIIRPARVADVPAMASLVNDYAEQGQMLHRSHAEFYEAVRDFLVAVDGDDAVLGVVGLRVMWANLAEVFALAVRSDLHRSGIGRQLVDGVTAEADRLGIARLFALTYARNFFETCGFEVVDRHKELPLKVWSECIRCSKRHACDEIAMVKALRDVPIAIPQAVESAGMSLPVLSEPIRRLEREAGQLDD